MTMGHRERVASREDLCGALALLISGRFGVNLRSSGYQCR
jgi:hypothetical protein